MPRLHHGFTLIELIVVILLLAILSVGTVRFLNDATSGWVSGTQRSEMAANLRHVVQHIGHVLREAAPGSVRVSVDGRCIELLSIANGSHYLSAPVGSTGSSMRVVPFDQPPSAASFRVLLAPSADLYGLGNPGPVSPLATQTAADADNVTTINFADPHQFDAASPQRRFFAVTTPTSYCIDNLALYQYRNYGYRPDQPQPLELPTALPNRNMLLSGVADISPIFVAADPSLTRNSVVTIRLTLTTADEQLALSHTVHVRNQL